MKLQENPNLETQVATQRPAQSLQEPVVSQLEPQTHSVQQSSSTGIARKRKAVDMSSIITPSSDTASSLTRSIVTALTPPDGVYRGGLQGDKRDGQGTMKHTSGVWSGYTFEGAWSDDRMHGHGVLIKSSVAVSALSSYIGDFACDALCGFGIALYANGETYSGGTVSQPEI
eukprot:gene21767-27823_t